MTPQLIAKKLNIPESDLTGPSRDSRLVIVRQAHWLILRRELTTVAIGEMYNRKHSTVSYGVARARELMEINDKRMLDMVNLLSALDS